MLETNVEKIKTHILCSVTFFFFFFFFMRKCGKILLSWAWHRLHYGAYALHAGYLRLQIQTLTICNIHCFSTATMVARTRLSVTLYVHSCLVDTFQSIHTIITYDYVHTSWLPIFRDVSIYLYLLLMLCIFRLGCV
jgi:hypothetical protein